MCDIVQLVAISWAVSHSVLSSTSSIETTAQPSMAHIKFLRDIYRTADVNDAGILNKSGLDVFVGMQASALSLCAHSHIVLLLSGPAEQPEMRCVDICVIAPELAYPTETTPIQ